MTKPNALYDISDNAVADPWFFDAGAEVPTQFTNADDALSGSGPSILGYRGGVLFRGCGAFGVLRPGVDLSGAYTASGLVQYVASLNAFVLLSSNSPAEAFWLE